MTLTLTSAGVAAGVDAPIRADVGAHDTTHGDDADVPRREVVVLSDLLDCLLRVDADAQAIRTRRGRRPAHRDGDTHARLDRLDRSFLAPDGEPHRVEDLEPDADNARCGAAAVRDVRRGGRGAADDGHGRVRHESRCRDREVGQDDVGDRDAHRFRSRAHEPRGDVRRPRDEGVCTHRQRDVLELEACRRRAGRSRSCCPSDSASWPVAVHPLVTGHALPVARADHRLRIDHLHRGAASLDRSRSVCRRGPSGVSWTWL